MILLATIYQRSIKTISFLYFPQQYTYLVGGLEQTEHQFHSPGFLASLELLSATLGNFTAIKFHCVCVCEMHEHLHANVKLFIPTLFNIEISTLCISRLASRRSSL